ncbi:hypothetical protein ACO2Q0_18290 [Phenylobacterium sp. VNQ135]|uniref:hypothetical protein n=1 Tax=Phenylobacterium sp. VNQ135 TaxID=3400922 RepID=UPI003C114509
MRWAVVGLAVALAAGAAEAAEHAYKAPRNRLGQPDLSGIWTNTSITWLQRPPGVKALVLSDAEAEAMGDEFRRMVDVLIRPTSDPAAPAPEETKAVDNSDFLEMDLKPARVNGQWRSSWIVEPEDGRLPFTEEGRARTRERGRGKGYDSYETRPTDERCLTAIGSPEGPPMMNSGFNGHYQILQTKDHVAILIEMNHDVRIVKLIAGPTAPRPIHHPNAPRWMGETVGWFEGDSLVMETTNHNPQGAYAGSMTGGMTYTQTAVVRERLTRTGPDSILYAFTVDDPATFAWPWRAEMPWRPAKGPIYEYACHEGNYSLANILGGARVQEAEARAAAPTRAN